MSEIKIAKFEYDDGTSMKEYEYTYKTDLNIKEKAEFVVFVTNRIISEHYNKVMYDFVFDLALIQMFTDIDIKNTILGIEDDIDDWEYIFALQRFMSKTTVLSEIKDGIKLGLLDELKEAVDCNIEYKTGVRPNRIEEAVLGLIDLITAKVKETEINVSDVKKNIEMFPKFVKNTSSQEMINAIASSPEVREMALKQNSKTANTRRTRTKRT